MKVSTVWKLSYFQEPRSQGGQGGQLTPYFFECAVHMRRLTPTHLLSAIPTFTPTFQCYPPPPSVTCLQRFRNVFQAIRRLRREALNSRLFACHDSLIISSRRRFPENHFPGKTDLSQTDNLYKYFRILLNTCSCSENCAMRTLAYH